MLEAKFDSRLSAQLQCTTNHYFFMSEQQLFRLIPMLVANTFLVLSPPPSLPRHMQSLRHEEAYRADIGTALKFLVAIDKLNIPEQVLLSKRLQRSV
jgi:hypothetical protein